MAGPGTASTALNHAEHREMMARMRRRRLTGILSLCGVLVVFVIVCGFVLSRRAYYPKAEPTIAPDGKPAWWFSPVGVEGRVYHKGLVKLCPHGWTFIDAEPALVRCHARRK